MIVGPDVYDLKTYQSIRQLPGAYEQRAMHALSANGRYFASGSKSPNQTDTTVTVWDTESGKQVLEVPGKKGVFVDVLAFAHNKFLLLGGRDGAEIQVWDVETAKVVGRLTVPDRRVSADKIAFSPDNKYFAHLGSDTLVVIDATTNKQVAVMAPPGPGVPAPGMKAGGTAPVFVFAWSRGLAFSPSGNELALFSTHPSPRLLVWDTSGQLVLDEPVPMPQFVSHNSTLEWMPDESGWLVNGYLYDRAAKRVLVSIRTPLGTSVLPHVIDKDRVIGVFGNDRTRLQTITIPWNKLAASMQQMTNKGAAYLIPGVPVSLDLVLTGLRGDEAETRRVLSEALTARLARDGIPVAAGSPTTLRLSLAETAGATLAIYERQSPFDFRGQDTGRRATEAKGAVSLELVTEGEAQPLWRGHLNAGSSRMFREEITNDTIRKSMLEKLTRQLNGIDMPYYIPKDKKTVALPAVVE